MGTIKFVGDITNLRPDKKKGFTEITQFIRSVSLPPYGFTSRPNDWNVRKNQADTPNGLGIYAMFSVQQLGGETKMECFMGTLWIEENNASHVKNITITSNWVFELTTNSNNLELLRYGKEFQIDQGQKVAKLLSEEFGMNIIVCTNDRKFMPTKLKPMVAPSFLPFVG